MTTPTTFTSQLTGLTYEVYTENDDHIYVVNEGHTVLVCNFDDNIRTTIEDHERHALYQPAH